MKNIVKVVRFNAEHARLYQLPEGIHVNAGTIVNVEAPEANTTAIGVTVTESYCVDGETEQMVVELLHFRPATLDYLKKVVAVYDEIPCVYPEADDEQQDDEE
jgi:hypothetical protein